MRLPRPVMRAAARVRPLVPASALPVLATLRSMVGDGPLIGTPSFRRVLVLGAHPDDETAGCGGLMALLARDGAEVHVVTATAGEATIGAASSPEETARRRTDELARACTTLGARPPRVLRHPDGQLADVVDDLAADLRMIVADLAPEAILLPWFLDGHRDHQAVVNAVQRAAVPLTTELWGYETWTPLPPNRLVDISEVLDDKEAALAAHATAHETFDVSSILGLNRYRAGYGGVPRAAAEAFLAAPAAEWFALMAR